MSLPGFSPGLPSHRAPHSSVSAQNLVSQYNEKDVIIRWALPHLFITKSINIPQPIFIAFYDTGSLDKMSEASSFPRVLDSIPFRLLMEFYLPRFSFSVASTSPFLLPRIYSSDNKCVVISPILKTNKTNQSTKIFLDPTCGFNFWGKVVCVYQLVQVLP